MIWYVQQNVVKCFMIRCLDLAIYTDLFTLSKDAEILGANTDNKFSFKSRTKISVEKLVRYSVTSLERLRTLITIIKESR